MRKKEFDLMQRGFESGYWEACRDIMTMVLKSVRNYPDSRILQSDKRFIAADLHLKAKGILQKKGYMPHEYDVIMGKAKEVDVPWKND